MYNSQKKFWKELLGIMKDQKIHPPEYMLKTLSEFGIPLP